MSPCCSDHDIADIVLQIVDGAVVGGEASLSLGHLGSVDRGHRRGRAEARQPGLGAESSLLGV